MNRTMYIDLSEGKSDNVFVYSRVILDSYDFVQSTMMKDEHWFDLNFIHSSGIRAEIKRTKDERPECNCQAKPIRYVIYKYIFMTVDI